MRPRYLATSATVHFLLLAFIFFSPWFQSKRPAFIIDGFDYIGDGGGSGGGNGDGNPKPPSIEKTHAGQPVPNPVSIPIPNKPAPIQNATKTEDAWAIQNTAPKIAPVKKNNDTVETGDKNQTQTTNVIRRGVDKNTSIGEGSFDFGKGTGANGPGTGPGSGKGVGIGFGDGSGSGFSAFGSYLRIMRQKIWSEWTQIAVLGTNSMCIVGLTVKKNGDVTDIKVEKPSGNSFYDTVALRAVRNSTPLPPLPTDFPDSEQRFRIQFRLLE